MQLRLWQLCGEENPSLSWARSRGEQQGWGFPAGAHPLRLAA